MRPAGSGKAGGASVSPAAEPLSDCSSAGDRSILSRSLATVNDVYPPTMQTSFLLLRSAPPTAVFKCWMPAATLHLKSGKECVPNCMT